MRKYLFLIPLLLATNALAFDATKANRYPSPDMYRPNVDSLTAFGGISTPSLTINGAGLNCAPGAACDVSSMKWKRESLSNLLSLLQKMGESISVAEYANSDGTIPCDKMAALQDRVKAESKSVFAFGHFTTACTLTIDHSADTSFSIGSPRAGIYGQGSGSTFWTYTGTGAAFRFIGGSQGSGQEAHQNISGITLVGTNAANSIGVDLSHIAWLRLDDLQITGFDKGINGVDVEYLRAFQTILRFNKRGVTMTSRANDPTQTVDPTSSDPNNHTWTASTLASNSEYGMDYTRPSSLSLIGCDIQYNGGSAPDGNSAGGARPGFGVRVTNAGTQGGVGLNLSGGYIEGNVGVADVWLRQNTASPNIVPAYAAVSQNIYRISGSGFTRVSNAQRTNNFIAIDFDANSMRPNIMVDAAFKNLGGSSTGQAIGFIGAKQRVDVGLDVSGSVFSNGEEVPEYSPYTASVARPSATSGFAGSAGLSFAQRWNTMQINGTVTVSAYGSGGSPTVQVALPKPIRLGEFGTCVAQNLSDNAPAFASIPQNASTFTLAVPVGDNKGFSVRCEYPVN